MTVYMQFTKHLTLEGALAKISFAPGVNLMPWGPPASCDCSVVVHHIQFPSQLLVWFPGKSGLMDHSHFLRRSPHLSLKPIKLLQRPRTWVDRPCVSSSAFIRPFLNRHTPNGKNPKKKETRASQRDKMSESCLRTALLRLSVLRQAAAETLPPHCVCVCVHLLLCGSLKTWQDSSLPHLFIYDAALGGATLTTSNTTNWSMKAITEQKRERSHC